MIKIFAAILGFFLIIGCSDEPPVEPNEENQQNNNETEIYEETNNETEIYEETNNEDEINEETNNEDKVNDVNDNDEVKDETPTNEGGLLEYRPEVGSKMIYTNGEEELYAYKIIAEDDEYIQVTISIGGNLTTHIYKWTTTELTLVYEDASPNNPGSNLLNEFDPTQINEKDIFINLEGTADWKLVSENESVTVPFGTFDNVYIVEKITDEVANADTILRKYYGPGVGLIKETYEVTGDNGYTDEATLHIVE